jgi:hypothetical protein
MNTSQRHSQQQWNEEEIPVSHGTSSLDTA